MQNKILRWFRYAHLPEQLQHVSRPFGNLAEHLAATTTPCAELTVALRKLLEAKDAALRAAIETMEAAPEPEKE